MPLLIRTTGLDEYLDPTGEAYTKMLLMGEPGSGKTPFGAQWPKPIFADCEDGLASIARLKMPYARIRSSKDMEDLVDHCRKDSLLPVERRKYRTFVLDTIDTYQRTLIEERKRTERKEAISGWQDWGWLDGKMTQLINDLVNLKMNVIVNMHVKDVEEGDDEARTLVKKAKLKGDIKDAIWQDFDLIGLIEKSYVMEGGTRVQKRQIRWHSEPKYPNLRDRFNVLPRFTDVNFDDHDYLQIFEAIANSLDDIPESGVAEEIEQVEEVEPAKDLQGGPVDKPNVPRTAAKKAAAKKAPAKKAAPKPKPEPKAEDAPTPGAADQATTSPEATVAEREAEAPAEGAPAAEDPWTSTAQPEELPVADAPIEPTLGRGTPDEPVVLPGSTSMAAESKAREKLDHVHDEQGTCLKNAFGEPCHLASLGAETIETTENAAQPEPEPPAASAPTPAPAAAPRAAGVRHCGDQPDSMKKFEAVPGCGVELTTANAARQQIAMLKKKTFLCDNCHDAAA